MSAKRLWICPLITMMSLMMMASRADAAGKLSLKQALDTITQDELERHVQFLASDTLEGREAGTTGAWAASKYIVGELKKAGLKPGDLDDDYFQYFNGNMRNIIAVLRGSDDRLRDEYVLIGAHYDHVGYGTQFNSRGPLGLVHNGADDNASGTAGLIEVAEALAELQPRPRRSVLVILWDGEEQGLLGSKFFAQNATVPIETIRMAINSDMIGRLRPRGIDVSGWRTAIGLRQLVARQNTGGLRLNFPYDYRPDSDHWPIFLHRIPSLMLHTGKHDDYHRPSDDIDKVNVEGVQLVSQLLLQLTLEMANSDELPPFRRDSVTEVSNLERLEQQVYHKTEFPSRLGVSYNSKLSETERRIVLIRVGEGSAAAEAGLKPSDEIIEFAGQKVTNHSDFRTLVITAPSPTMTVVKRGDKILKLPVKLKGQRARFGFEWTRDKVEPNSIIVSNVLPGSPADLAGLKQKQRITGIAGQPVGKGKPFEDRLLETASPIVLDIEEHGHFRTLKMIRIDDPVRSASNSKAE